MLVTIPNYSTCHSWGFHKRRLLGAGSRTYPQHGRKPSPAKRVSHLTLTDCCPPSPAKLSRSSSPPRAASFSSRLRPHRAPTAKASSRQPTRCTCLRRHQDREMTGKKSSSNPKFCLASRRDHSHEVISSGVTATRGSPPNQPMILSAHHRSFTSRNPLQRGYRNIQKPGDREQENHLY